MPVRGLGLPTHCSGYEIDMDLDLAWTSLVPVISANFANYTTAYTIVEVFICQKIRAHITIRIVVIDWSFLFIITVYPYDSSSFHMNLIMTILQTIYQIIRKPVGQKYLLIITSLTRFVFYNHQNYVHELNGVSDSKFQNFLGKRAPYPLQGLASLAFDTLCLR